MNRGTVIMVLIALGSALGAVAMRPQPMDPPTFEDTGDELFPEFTDPNVATSLEVVEYDAKSAQLDRFSVKLIDGRWVIPSHNNYPADGTEQMAKAAVSFIGAKKDVFRSDNPKDHAGFGVLAPDAETAEDDARGRRVIIKDASDTTLVDIIIGKDVPDRQGFKFVRFPGENRVYASEIAPEASTSFTDWIEEDLLKIETGDIVAVVSNSYSVDEQAGAIVDDNPLFFELVDSGAIGAEGPDVQWSLVTPKIYGPDGEVIDPETYEGEAALPEMPGPPEGKELNPSKVKQIVGAADRLKIVGVRPRPEQLNPMDLQLKGFFLVGEPPRMSLRGNEGEVRLIARDGVTYTLFFGEVTYASGEALTAGGEEEPTGEESKTEDNARANRYMFVNVSYDEQRDQTRDEPPLSGELRGAERAKQLAQRFNQWYYVIPDYGFTQLHKKPEDFWREAK